MRRHAKASSAGSTLGINRARNLFGRSFATRGASSGGNGSGAPSHGRRAAVLLTLVAFLALAVGITTASAANKYVAFFVGSPSGAAGETAGLLNTPRDVAVNQAGTGGASAGDFYVAEGGNNRVSQFNAAGTFIRAFGQDVVSSGPDQANEVQTVTVNATAGTFNLTFNAQTTPDLPYNETAANVATALNALSSISTGGGSVTVSGVGTAASPYVVTFNGGPLAGTDVSQMTSANGTVPLSGGSGAGANTAAVVTANSGATGYEICNALTNRTDVCKAGTTGGLGGAMSSPRGVAINQSTGHLYVTDGGNLRVQEFTATGQWVRAWGADVVQPGGVGETFVQVNERQKVELPPVFGFAAIVGGTFTLTFNGQTTAPIKFNAIPSEVESALVALSNIGPGDVSVSGSNGGPWSVEFTGALGLVNQPQMIGDGSALEAEFFGTGFGEASVTTLQQGGPGGGPEVCSIAQQCKVGVPGPFAGGFGASFIGFPAVAPAGSPNAGDVYVADSGNSRMQEFTSAGAFVRMFGGDVTAGGGSGPEVCSVAANCKSGLVGGLVGQFGSSAPTGVAVSSTGTIYALDQNNFRMEAFDSSGGSPTVFSPGIVGKGNTILDDVAVGPADRVFVAQSCPFKDTSCPGGVGFEEWLYELDSSGTTLNTSLVGAEFPIGMGLAANTANDRVYFTNQSGSIGHRAGVMDDTGSLPHPILTINPPTELTEHTASFTGTVNPNGLPGISTSYHFEYSKNGVTWTPVAADVNLGSGTSPINVPVASAEGAVTGLEANTFYRVRILATRSRAAGLTPSAELTFLTDGVKPEVTTYYPQSHTDTTARLTGRLNANNMATSYHFEYGKTTAYGSSSPVPAATSSNGISHLVFEEVEGLEPNTTYHYRLVATNAEGTSNGEDKSFKTYEAGASAVPGRGYEMVTPPFKATRVNASFGGEVGSNPNPSVPSLDGESLLWKSSIFPLTEDVVGAASGDIRRFSRTSIGWKWETLNTRAVTSRSGGESHPEAGPTFTKMFMKATSGDQQTSAIDLDQNELLPSDGYKPNILYTRRTGTGTDGFTGWLTNADTQVGPTGNLDGTDHAQLNDDGSAMLRWGSYRGLAEDPNTPGDDDPSDEQTVAADVPVPYLLQATNPDDLPAAPKQLVSECTGTGGSATLIPNRAGTGSSSTDTIGTQVCERQGPAPATTGTGVRTQGSSTLTSVTTTTGAFSVGQIIAGAGIPGGTLVTAVGAGTLTLSNPATCNGAQGQNATLTAGSPVVTTVQTTCGQFTVGQTVTGAGIPGGTTITQVNGYSLTLSANATASATNVNLAVSAPTVTSLRADSQHVTSREGARGGGLGSTGALSEDGNRVFFTSPGAGSSSSCSTGAGVETNCPAQLFVRQYDSSGNPTVRWISRAQGIGTQQIGEMGQALFSGASRDGRYVYFQTNSPLLPTDPNAGSSLTTGTAQENSWDLYRYALPASRDTDPGTGALTRISGGPTGAADPSTNTSSAAGTLRYLSGDGKRAYFVTTSPIAGAENNPPKGGSTTPGGAVGNTATRDLYLFDDTGGTPAWRFIARIPYSTASEGGDGNALNTCASSSPVVGAQYSSFNKARTQRGTNCFRGTEDGSAVIFFTRGQLTADDDDAAADIYLYNANSDELVRVSAPLSDTATPYVCNAPDSGKPSGFCNADLGINAEGAGAFGNSAGTLDVARGWGGGRLYNVGQDANGDVSVYFASQSELLPADNNGSHWDVYQWKGGRLSLVSPGIGEGDSYYAGSSVDGRDVFLVTTLRIDPREIDDADFDIYDARAGGGFPYTPPATPCDVLAHQCRGPASTAPPTPLAASRTLKGSGNAGKAAAKPKKCGKGKVRRHGRCVKKQPPGSKHKQRGDRTNSVKQGRGK